jgi:hypothetical protein
MRPTFSRFDIHDLLDTLPPFVRHPMALATMASVLAHGVIAVGLPVFAGTEEKEPERIVDVISLSPAEQGKLPSNGLMMPGGGLNGTSALPLPLTKNGAFSPLSGLSGSTLGSSGSPYSGVPGLLDPPIISYTQTAPPRTNSDSGFKKSSTKLLFPGFDGSKSDLKFDWSKQATEQEPDRTANKDKTDPPPGEKPPASSEIAALNPGETGGTPSKPPEGTQEDAANKLQQPNLNQPPTAPVLTVAEALGQPQANFEVATMEVNTKSIEGMVAFSQKAAVYTDMLAKIAKQTDPTWTADNVFDTDTTAHPLLLELPSIPIPKTSDALITQPVQPEFLLLITPQGTIYLDRDQKGNPVFQPAVLRETGYLKLTNQAIAYMQTQLPAIQKAVTEQVLPTNPPNPKKPGTYRYLRVMFKPAAATATG